MRSYQKLLPALALLGPLGCDDVSQTEGDLTSVRARSRELRFEGRVFVEPGTSDDEILRLVHKQTKTAFGPLRTSEVMVNNRELKGVDPATFVKRDVTVVDTEAGGEGAPMVEVRYTYVDDAVVPKSMSSRSSLAGAVLRPDYQSESQRILEECTPNDSHARDFASALWYVFEPSGRKCGEAIATEQASIDEARAKLTDVESQVAKVDAERLYLPVTFALGADKTNKGKSYPEYDRLFSGGVKDDKLVISLINGLIDHEPGTELHRDSGYGEWLDTLQEIFEAQPGFKVVEVEDGADIFSYELGSGKSVTLTFDDIIAMDDGTAPQGLSHAEKSELEALVAERVADKWITFELPVTVQIGDGDAKDFGIQITTFFGHAETTTPFKHAIKNSDVFLYNGHSMIGSGPLDPRNFTKSDFPESYQILFVDGCVSYNYYEADYVPLKEGGTKNLDLITNALESPAWRSGYALGQFISLLIDGNGASYLELLQSAEATGSGLRVVDGELDNEYSPDSDPITITAR
ncbi:MAG: hypothetical protein JNL21_05110 [Myxococcales bacterium]|nr:hypothetical protein [Myxococcales bacterium]